MLTCINGRRLLFCCTFTRFIHFSLSSHFLNSRVVKWVSPANMIVLLDTDSGINVSIMAYITNKTVTFFSSNNRKSQRLDPSYTTLSVQFNATPTQHNANKKSALFYASLGRYDYSFPALLVFYRLAHSDKFFSGCWMDTNSRIKYSFGRTRFKRHR